MQKKCHEFEKIGCVIMPVLYRISNMKAFYLKKQAQTRYIHLNSFVITFFLVKKGLPDDREEFVS